MKIPSKPLLLSLFTVATAISVGAAVVGAHQSAQSQPSAKIHANATPANGPDCAGGWPTDMAFSLLKNAGVTDNDEVDFDKTKTTRVASEKIGKDLYHQVYDVVFTKKDGETLEAIAVHDASNEECSMTGVELFVVSRKLNPESR
jgi:hypothetical protein